MGYRSLRQCVEDLEQHGHLCRIDAPVDAYLEAAAIQRRVCEAGGPALLFTNVTGCQFPMVSNLFGTLERSQFMFRDTYRAVQKLIDLKVDPTRALKSPLSYAAAPLSALRMLPKLVRSGPAVERETTLSQLPNLVSWPRDGGPFVTLPQVYTEDPNAPGLMKSNLGMYRIQLAGNDYVTDQEVGLHYQLHRSIGVHQAAAMQAGKPFQVNIFVGGTPAMNLAAVMPLPEGMSELTFAGALGGRRIGMVRRTDSLPVYADADFAICGTVVPNGKEDSSPVMKPEGPFGDHLGYYSLQHPFPVLKVDHVYHRSDPIWAFTVVGRPPQEDTRFGELIHDLTGPVIPSVLPGVKGVNAVDASGVHPLLLAIGSERYMPFLAEPRPQEILTQANAILGQGQLSLAKFLWIADVGCWQDEASALHDLHEIKPFFTQMLSRTDWRRDLHFLTETTIDTLDYSGDRLNVGSKLIVAAAGPKRFELEKELPAQIGTLPDGFREPRVVTSGVVALSAPKLPKPTFDYDAVRRGDFSGEQMESKSLGDALSGASEDLQRFCRQLPIDHPLCQFRIILLVDDSSFLATTNGPQGINNFLWATFTRANPAADIAGVGSFVDRKHWGCRGPLVIDARIKPHHAPILEEDPEVTSKIEAMAVNGGPLDGLF